MQGISKSITEELFPQSSVFDKLNRR